VFESFGVQPTNMIFEPVILAADDREDDIELTKHALLKANVLNPLQVARDGEEAIQYLEGVGKFSNRAEYPLPDLMLLDLSMPKLTGFDVLHWVRSHPSLKALRIVVLTTSAETTDVDRAYALGANAFLVKPIDFKRYCMMIEATVFFWLELGRSPSISRQANGRETPQQQYSGAK